MVSVAPPLLAASEAAVGVYVEKGRRVRPLYQQLFSIDDPTLVLAGLPFRIVPFPVFYLQGYMGFIHISLYLYWELIVYIVILI